MHRPRHIIQPPDHPHREGATRCARSNQVLFEVAPRANKIQIRDAVEKLFNVKVVERQHA